MCVWCLEGNFLSSCIVSYSRTKLRTKLCLNSIAFTHPTSVSLSPFSLSLASPPPTHAHIHVLMYTRTHTHTLSLPLLSLTVSMDNVSSQYSQTALHHASSSGHTDVIKQLVDCGAQIDNKDIVSSEPSIVLHCDSFSIISIPPPYTHTLPPSHFCPSLRHYCLI